MCVCVCVYLCAYSLLVDRYIPTLLLHSAHSVDRNFLCVSYYYTLVVVVHYMFFGILGFGFGERARRMYVCARVYVGFLRSVLRFSVIQFAVATLVSWSVVLCCHRCNRYTRR